MRSRRREAGLGKAEQQQQQQQRGFPWQEPEAPLWWPKEVLPSLARVPSTWLPLQPQAMGCGTHSAWSMGQQVCAADLGKGWRAGPRRPAKNAPGPAQLCRKHWVGRWAEGRVGRRTGPDLRGLALTSPSLGRTESWQPPAAPGTRDTQSSLPPPRAGCQPAFAVRTDGRRWLPKCVLSAGC